MNVNNKNNCTLKLTDKILTNNQKTTSVLRQMEVRMTKLQQFHKTS